MGEHEEQVALFQWAAHTASRYPELALLHAIPNGGWRHKATARRLKAEGLQRGVPDICLPVPRGGYHGLYIEMKFGQNKPTSDQAWWLRNLTRKGYRALVCYGYLQARDAILEYLRDGDDLPTLPV